MEYELGELLPYEQPADYIVESTDYDDSYKTPVLTAGKSFIIGYTNETKGIYTKLPVIIFDDFTTSSQYVDFPFKVKSSAMKILSVNSEIADLKYLFYKMQTIQFDSANHKRYWISEYSKIKLDLPTLVEQQRIVNRIETMFSKLDQAQEKAQAVLDSFETRKAAILHKAFTGELTANWRKENGVKDDSWEERTLDDIAEYKKGPFGSSITKAMFVPKSNNTYKVYEQGNAIRKTINYGSYYITQEKYNELKSFAVQPNDIIISCAGTIGEVFKLPNEIEQGVINQALMRVRIKSNTNEKFFIYYFGEVIKGDVQNKSNGTAIQNIPPFKIMKAMTINLPSLHEQQEIVRILDNVLEKESRAKGAAQTVLDQIALLKKSILARAFRGEL